MDQIIRTCSSCALALIVAAPAVAQTADAATLDAYVQGRLLDAAGASNEAALAYGAALTGAPGDERIAMRAYRQAIKAGDKALALRAARALDALRKLPGDGRLLLYTEALAKGDWRGANLQIDKLDGGNFDFLSPILRAWVAFGGREADPAAMISGRSTQGLTAAYAREQRAYLLLAMKNAKEGKAAAQALATGDARGLWIKLAAASRLAALKDREGALALLDGTDPALAKARAIISSGQSLGSAVETPSDAAGVLFARLASDLLRDNAIASALTLARLGSFAAPDHPQTGLILAQALSAAGLQQSALATLALWESEPLFGSVRRDVKFTALQRSGRDDEALAMAEAAASDANADVYDHGRLGDALTKKKLYARAADAYKKAIDLADARGGAPWNLWLLYGGALDSAGDWAKAKPALQKAVALAPDQPTALNHLGYAMLERRDDLTEATRLVAKASAMRPDDPAITDSLGWAFFLRGQTAESIAMLERAVAADPTEAALSEHLGDAYWKAGRRVDARYAWNAALVQAETGDEEARIRAKIADGIE